MMGKEINIFYEVNDSEVSVLISYTIETTANIQTISCTVSKDGLNIPVWLQLRKFELKSILSDEGYMPLFTDNDNIKNMKTSVFIDKTYSEIMAREKFKMAAVSY